MRPAAQGVGRGGGCPVTRRDIFFFLSREELAPRRGGVPGARLGRSVGSRGCGTEAITAP